MSDRWRNVLLPLLVGMVLVLLGTVAQAEPERVTLRVRGMA